MNSLEFIKQHVTEWPSDKYHTVLLHSNGFAVFANSFEPCVGVHSINLSEHFAPDYYDGKVWTREEFEACGVVECRYNKSLPHPLLKREGDKYSYYVEGTWCEYETMIRSHWERAIKISDSMAANYLKQSSVVESTPDNLDDGKKYEATIIGLCGTAVKIDIYRVLDAYPQIDPHIGHLIKKALKPGERGHKDKRTDYLNIIESAQKALKLLDQKERLNDE